MQQVSNHGFISILSSFAKSQNLCKLDTSCPKTCSVRQENMSESHKTLFLIIKTMFGQDVNKLILQMPGPKFNNPCKLES